jgi:UDP-galactopyranose mutase
MTAQRSVLVVGAGFAGAVTARVLAENGFFVDIIDRRPHIGGNAYDRLSNTGVRVHLYGPHFLHTNSEHVFTWLRRFGKFLPYEHRVEALVGISRYVPFPINRITINTIFNKNLSIGSEVKDFLADIAIKSDGAQNAAAFLYSRIGDTLTDLLFRPYTKKMWDLDLEDLSLDVVKRIPIYTDDEDRYFPNDRIQVLPETGYAAVFANILDHDKIRIHLNTPFERGMDKSYFHCFNSMAIDEYYDGMFGLLPYRSIRFEHREETLNYRNGRASVVNFTDDRPHTRETDWTRLPKHGHGTESKTITLEQPCDYRDNSYDRYYPVKTSDRRNGKIYRRYKEHAAIKTNDDVHWPLRYLSVPGHAPGHQPVA